MHWHAMRRSAASLEDTRPTSYDNILQTDGEVEIAEEMIHQLNVGDPIQQGHDDTSDNLRDAFSAYDRFSVKSPVTGRSSDENKSTDTEQELSETVIRTFTAGPVTFAYERALRNRIQYAKLLKQYDTHHFTPTFVHDCLMLPGSLANVMGKVRNVSRSLPFSADGLARPLRRRSSIV